MKPKSCKSRNSSISKSLVSCIALVLMTVFTFVIGCGSGDNSASPDTKKDPSSNSVSDPNDSLSTINDEGAIAPERNGSASIILWTDPVDSSSMNRGWYIADRSGPAFWYLTPNTFREGATNGGNYGNDENDFLYSPQIWVPPNSTGLYLQFTTHYRTEYNYDFGYVKYTSNGSTYTTLDTYHGSNPGYPGWITKRYSLPSTGSSGKYYRLRFRFTSDGSVTYPGWQIDDIKLTRGG